MFRLWLGLKAVAFGLALTGFGPENLKLQARPKPRRGKALAWSAKPEATAFWQATMPKFGFCLAKSRPSQSRLKAKILALALVPEPKSRGILA
jgi:hypothetical protein